MQILRSSGSLCPLWIPRAFSSASVACKEASSHQPKPADLEPRTDTPPSHGSAKEHKGDVAYIRIAPRVKGSAGNWTAHDILSFLEDPSVKSRDLRVELERFSLRPVAWWVRYSKHKQERILKALGSPDSRWGKISRLGTADVFVRAADVEALDQHSRLVLSPASGRRVLVESEQELTVDKIENWLSGYHLSNNIKSRIDILQQPYDNDQKGRHRAVVVFSDPFEAHLAVTDMHQSHLDSLPVFLRLLP